MNPECGSIAGDTAMLRVCADHLAVVLTADSTKKRYKCLEQTKCYNCSQTHVANFRGCPFRKKALSERHAGARESETAPCQ